MASFRANTDKVVWRVVDGEAVLVHADTSAYYGLNGTGTYIWQAILAASLTPEDIARRLSACYGSVPESVLGDVEAFLVTVGKETLVMETPGPDGHSAEDSRTSEARRPENRYEPPSLTRFGELEKLVLSGE